MHIVDHIIKTLQTESLLETCNQFYFVPIDVIIDIYEEYNTSLYANLAYEEEAWCSTDVNSHLSI